jgi:drug/metabolite transporter (DMT)-like permease
MGRVCAVAAATCIALALATGEPLTGWPARTWALLALAVALPQLVGHQGLAWAVAWVPASRLSAATLLEPVVATAIAAALLGERPGLAAAAGGATVLIGVWICVRGGFTPKPAVDAPVASAW